LLFYYKNLQRGGEKPTFAERASNLKVIQSPRCFECRRGSARRLGERTGRSSSSLRPIGILRHEDARHGRSGGRGHGRRRGEGAGPAVVTGPRDPSEHVAAVFIFVRGKKKFVFSHFRIFAFCILLKTGRDIGTFKMNLDWK